MPPTMTLRVPLYRHFNWLRRSQSLFFHTCFTWWFRLEDQCPYLVCHKASRAAADGKQPFHECFELPPSGWRCGLESGAIDTWPPLFNMCSKNTFCSFVFQQVFCTLRSYRQETMFIVHMTCLNFFLLPLFVISAIFYSTLLMDKSVLMSCKPNFPSGSIKTEINQTFHAWSFVFCINYYHV